MQKSKAAYRPINDYGIIGDCRCAALISRDGSLDWLCLPRFDSPAVFCAILDQEKGGRFTIQPASDFESEQNYIKDSNVLQTIFNTGEGQIRLTDLMPITSTEDRAGGLFPERHILRVVECLHGEADVVVDFIPRLDFGSTIPRMEDRGALGLFFQHRGRVVNLATDLRLDLSAREGSARGRVRLRKGDRHYLSLAFTMGEPAILPAHGKEADLSIDRTVRWWKEWAGKCAYEGKYRDFVIRSALTLKLLAYSPSGAIVAAPTASLPEWIGGTRNWDYRYCWLRDASMTLHALYRLGYVEEARAFLAWLIHTTRLTRPELKVLYDVYGQSNLREIELGHLEGYSQSRPVRIGNSASEQVQLDIYGEVVDGAFACSSWGTELDRPTKAMLVGFGETVCKKWREPDEGIWEIRLERKHYTFSKVMCWVTLDRLLKMHEAGHLKVPYKRFASERDAIRSEIETHGYDDSIRSYTFWFGEDCVDVSLLLLPFFDYIDARNPRFLSTYDHIEKQLGKRGFLYRYPPETDGLQGEEGAFAAASFWAVQCLVDQGRRDDARERFEHLLSFSNHLGLFAEEVDPETGAALGNFPQAYTHVGLINAAIRLSEDDGTMINPKEQIPGSGDR